MSTEYSTEWAPLQQQSPPRSPPRSPNAKVQTLPAPTTRTRTNTIETRRLQPLMAPLDKQEVAQTPMQSFEADEIHAATLASSTAVTTERWLSDLLPSELIRQITKYAAADADWLTLCQIQQTCKRLRGIVGSDAVVCWPEYKPPQNLVMTSHTCSVCGRIDGKIIQVPCLEWHHGWMVCSALGCKTVLRFSNAKYLNTLDVPWLPMSSQTGFPRTLRFYRHRTNKLLDCNIISLPKLDHRKPWGEALSPRLMFKIAWDSHKYEKDITFGELLIVNPEVFGPDPADLASRMLRQCLPSYFTVQTCRKFEDALASEFALVAAVALSGGCPHDQYTHLAWAFMRIAEAAKHEAATTDQAADALETIATPERQHSDERGDAVTATPVATSKG